MSNFYRIGVIILTTANTDKRISLEEIKTKIAELKREERNAVIRKNEISDEMMKRRKKNQRLWNAFRDFENEARSKIKIWKEELEKIKQNGNRLCDKSRRDQLQRQIDDVEDQIRIRHRDTINDNLPEDWTEYNLIIANESIIQGNLKKLRNQKKKLEKK